LRRITSKSWLGAPFHRDAAIARVHAFDNGKTYRRAALDDPTANDRYVGSNLMNPQAIA
jgi:hypothetical protein